MNEIRPLRLHPLRGIDQRHIPEPNTMRRLEDVSWDGRDGWQQGPGFRRLLSTGTGGANPFSGCGAILSMGWFAQKGGARQWLVFERDLGTGYAELDYYNPSALRTGAPYTALKRTDGTSVTTRAVIQSPAAGTQYVTWGDRLYILNGINEPLVFNGAYVDTVGWTQAPAPPSGQLFTSTDESARRYEWDGASLTGTEIQGIGVGFGNTVNSARAYRCSFLNERGEESPLSAPSAVVIVTSADVYRHTIRVNLPKRPENAVAVRLYATANLMDSNGEFVSTAEGATYSFHSTIEDGVTDFIIDYFPDTALGAAVDDLDFGPWPAGAKFAAVWDGKMWLAGMDGAVVAHSAPGHPEVYPVDNRIPLGDDTAGPITGMWATRASLLVFKQRAVYRIFEDRGSYRAVTLTKDVGCASADTIREVPGLGVVFLSEAGVFLLALDPTVDSVPTRVVNLSAPITELVKRFNRSALANACAAVYRSARELWIPVPTLATTTPDLVLVYHYDIGAWSTRTGFPINCILETADHRGYLLFGSWDGTNDPGIHHVGQGWGTKGDNSATNTITPLLETNDITVSGFTNFSPRHLNVLALGVGNNDMTLNYRVNRTLTDIRPAVATVDQQDPNAQLAVYDTATWGTSVWGDHHPVVLRFDTATGHKGPVFSYRATLSSAGRRVQWIALDLGLQVDDGAKVQPLSAGVGPTTRR